MNPSQPEYHQFIGRGGRIKKSPPKDTWGPWRFRRSNLTLCHTKVVGYDLDLERINSCAEMLDWIFQLSHKNLKVYGEDVVNQLVAAFDDIFKPQENCCSWGKEKQFSGSKLAKAYAAKLQEHKKQIGGLS